MATHKTGLSYFSVDTDRFQDMKIKRLKKDFGCDGFAVYEYILNEIYRVRGCFLVWDESTAFDVAEYWGLKENKVNEIVRYCCAVGLFDKALLTSGSVISSPSIQSRYVNMCIKAKRKKIIIPEQYDIIPEECRKILEEYRKIPEDCRKVKKNNSKENTSSTDVDEVQKKGKIFPSPSSLSFAKDLDEEIKALKADTIWLDQLQTLHHVPRDELIRRLDDFELQCAADGIERHSGGIRDAKSHYNNWLRIVLKNEKDDKNRTRKNPDRGGNLLKADERKDYGNEF